VRKTFERFAQFSSRKSLHLGISEFHRAIPEMENEKEREREREREKSLCGDRMIVLSTRRTKGARLPIRLTYIPAISAIHRYSGARE